jgi:hypothetical protein
MSWVYSFRVNNKHGLLLTKYWLREARRDLNVQNCMVITAIPNLTNTVSKMPIFQAENGSFFLKFVNFLQIFHSIL